MSDPYKTPEADLAVDLELDMEQRLASRWLRLGGALLDGFITGIPIVGVAYVVGVYDNITPGGMLPIADQVLGAIIGISIFMLINAYLIYTRGQTVGKLICRTRVVTLEGEQVSGNTYVFLRLLPLWIVTQIPLLGNIVALINALLIFRKEHNCLHDDIAKTRVIKI